MEDEIKKGARDSRGDQANLQQIHDYAVSNGAMCEPVKSADPEAVAYFGSSVKALGDGKVGGYLVRYGSADEPDLTDDFFDAETDIHAPDILPVLYQHGMDRKMGKRMFGEAKTGRDEVGMWIEAQLNMRDEYEKAIYALAELEWYASLTTDKLYIEVPGEYCKGGPLRFAHLYYFPPGLLFDAVDKLGFHITDMETKPNTRILAEIE
jgi:hypothetical protein